MTECCRTACGGPHTKQAARLRRTEHRSEEMLKAVSDPNQSTDKRKKSQDHQRRQHHHGTLMRSAVFVSVVSVSAVAMRIYFGSAIVAKERHIQQAEHVEGRNERGDDADCPVDRVRLIGLP